MRLATSDTPPRCRRPCSRQWWPQCRRPAGQLDEWREYILSGWMVDPAAARAFLKEARAMAKARGLYWEEPIDISAANAQAAKVEREWDASAHKRT